MLRWLLLYPLDPVQRCATHTHRFRPGSSYCWWWRDGLWPTDLWPRATVEFVKAKPTNQAGLYLRDEAITDFGAFAAVSGEIYFSPSHAWTAQWGVWGSCQTGCVVSAGLVLLLEDGAPLRWSPAQHGVPLVKPVISICFLSFCIIYDSHFAITEHFWDKSHLIVMWFGFDLLVLCWEISYPCSLRIWICDSPFWRVISLVLECSDVGPMKSSLCSIFWNSLSIGVTSSSGTFCRVRQ